jgi:biopolymer transport protein ExbD
MDGLKQQPRVSLSASKEIPYAEVVKTIDMLGAVGIKKISIDPMRTIKP